MAAFRTEILFDGSTGLFFTELYFPLDADEPEYVTAPVYGSPEEAERDALRVFRWAYSDALERVLA